MTDSISIRNCTLSLPGTGEILSRLDLELRCGGVTWLVGESGTGKSTLCNLLAGLSPTGSTAAGTLELGGKAGSGGRARFLETAGRGARAGSFAFGAARGRRGLAKLRRTGVLAWAPQNAMDTFPPQLRLRDWFARSGFPTPDLAPFGLDAAMLGKFAHEFSGGQISRISLAAALARDPRLLVCDEPTAGLDPSQADAVVAVINSHASAADRAVLAVTHDLSGLQRNARPEDRVAVIFAGHIVETSSAADFLAGRTENAYARALAAAAPSAGAHPLPVADESRPRPWTYRPGDELRRLGEGEGDLADRRGAGAWSDQLGEGWVAPAERRDSSERSDRLGEGGPGQLAGTGPDGQDGGRDGTR